MAKKPSSTPKQRLEAVHSDIEQFRREWDALGRPLYALGTKGVHVAHPLIRMIRAAEQSAYRMERRNAPTGRPLGAQSAADRVAGRS